MAKVTESQKQKIWKLRRQGCSYGEISMRTGIANHNIAYYVKAMSPTVTETEVGSTALVSDFNEPSKTSLVSSLIASNLAREAKLHFIGLVI